MWNEDDGPHEGRPYRLAETLCSPQPVQRPRPPVMIGGSGERKTLRLVAEYGDACTLLDTDVETVAHELSALAGHCADLGRDPAEVRRTVIGGADPFDPDCLHRMST